MKFVGGAFDYWCLENLLSEQAYEDVLTAMRAEGEAEATLKRSTKV